MTNWRVRNGDDTSSPRMLQGVRTARQTLPIRTTPELLTEIMDNAIHVAEESQLSEFYKGKIIKAFVHTLHGDLEKDGLPTLPQITDRLDQFKTDILSHTNQYGTLIEPLSKAVTEMADSTEEMLRDWLKTKTNRCSDLKTGSAGACR